MADMPHAVEARPKRRGLFAPGLSGNERRLGLIFSLPAVLIFVAVLGYPIFENIRSSFFDVDFGSGASEFIGLANFSEVLSDRTLRTNLLQTLYWAVGSLIGQLGLGLAAAILIDQPWRGMRYIRQILLIPYVVPVIATALVWQWMLDGNYGVISAAMQAGGFLAEGATPLGQESSALMTVVIINIWRGFPFAMLIYWATLQGIDQTQYEAAMVDGAGPIRRFWSITLPNLKSATIALLAIRGLWTLMYFELIWLTTRGGPAGSSDVLSTYLYRIIMGEFRLGYAAAIATSVGLIIGTLIAVWYIVKKVKVKR